MWLVTHRWEHTLLVHLKHPKSWHVESLESTSLAVLKAQWQPSKIMSNAQASRHARKQWSKVINQNLGFICSCQPRRAFQGTRIDIWTPQDLPSCWAHRGEVSQQLEIRISVVRLVRIIKRDGGHKMNGWISLKLDNCGIQLMRHHYEWWSGTQGRGK